MIDHSILRGLVAILLAAGVAACGGGGGGGGDAPAPLAGGGTGSGGTTGGGTSGGGTTGGGTTGGATGDGGLVSGGARLRLDTSDSGVRFDVASGGTGLNALFAEANGFGSILVDGRSVNTDAAVFTVEGQAAAQADLKQGQTLLILTDASGAATGVHYRANVRGVVTSVNVVDAALAQAELSVFGQVVRTNASTAFSDVDVGNLAVGQLLEVSGTLNDTGAIEASFVELKSSLEDYKATGQISNLTATTFTLGGLNVDYASASLQNFDVAIAAGDAVEVRGPAASFSTPDQFEARDVERLPDVTIGETVSVQLDGFVDRFVSATDFDVQSFAVTTDASTRFTNGSAASIALGVKLLVIGTTGDDGRLLATDITVQPTNAVRAEGPLESVDVAARSVTVLGVTFAARDLLRLEDDSSAGVDPLTLNDLGTGDQLEVRGHLDGMVLVANRIDRDDPRDRARLRGPVGSEDAQARTLDVLGVTITGQEGVTEYRDVDDTIISADAFHDQVELGTFVRARWDTFSSTSQVADELSIEE